MRTRLAPLLAWLGLIGPGCAHFPETPPIEAWQPHRPVLAMATPGKSRELVVMLAFSGGGTRAAALSYGVLEALRDTWIEVDGRPRRLLDEVDLISSVSGGSFTAAYYGLFGDRIFEDYEQAFLRRNVQSALIWRLFDPRNWWKLGSPLWGRSDLAADYYDKILFEGRTIRQFGEAPGPAILINATDVTRGARFAFTREQFDPICSNLVEYRVSRAVAASSAVPGLLSPIMVSNKRGSCGYEKPEWVERAIRTSRYGSRRYIQARTAESYLEKDAMPLIYLIDGGVTDNLGVRSAFDYVVAEGSLGRILEAAGLGDARIMLMIVVNAQNEPELRLDDIGFFRSLGLMAGIASGIQIRHYNYETLELVRTSFQSWARRLDGPERSFHFHMVEVGFWDVGDPDTRRRLNNLPTSFRLDDEEVDLLRRTAREQLRLSRDFDDALDDIGRAPAPPAPAGPSTSGPEPSGAADEPHP